MSGYDDDSRTDSDKAGRNGRIITIFITPGGGKYNSISIQQLGEVGIAFITGSQQSYWHTDEKFFVAGGIQRYAGGDCMERFLQQ
ncbi:hypothetical protein KCP71_01745 [Salmonella enterica subsp. enterica]|nr:hypothetical protein KCP71_01745 [Salmonella enterica subsp. enterica]